jgi:hypothetical protein
MQARPSACNIPEAIRVPDVRPEGRPQMQARSVFARALVASAAVLAIAQPVSADTCCANVPVQPAPRSVDPGDVVTLTGLQCLRSDGTGPLALNLVSFWLATGRRPAEDPADVPGNLPYPDLPDVATWYPFASAPPFDTATSAPATIVVPDVADGRYQLWWLCDNGGGPGSGIHYSTGPSLTVGSPPDTATAPVLPAGGSRPSAWPAWLLLGPGMVALAIGVLRPAGDRRRATGARKRQARAACPAEPPPYPGRSPR